METWNTMLLIVETFCAFFVIAAALSLLWDIAKTIWHQARSESYKMDAVKFLEYERKWWEWLLVIAAAALGIYALIPHPWLERADFRAKQEKDEYTAYYACSYRLDNPDEILDGDGVVEVRKSGDLLCAQALYMDRGRVALGFWMDEDDEENAKVHGVLKDEWNAEIEIGELLPRISVSALNQQEYMYYGKVCLYCGNVVDPKYIYTTEWSDEVCPVCIYKWYDEQNEWGVWKCGRCNTFYEGSKTEFSPCPDCGES